MNRGLLAYNPVRIGPLQNQTKAMMPSAPPMPQSNPLGDMSKMGQLMGLLGGSDKMGQMAQMPGAQTFAAREPFMQQMTPLPNSLPPEGLQGPAAMMPGSIQNFGGANPMMEFAMQDPRLMALLGGFK